MKIRDMIAAAARPWFSVQHSVGLDASGDAENRSVEVQINCGEYGSARLSSDGGYVRVGRSFWRAFELVLAAERDGDEWRWPYREWSMSVLRRTVRLQSSPCMLVLGTGGWLSEGHVLSVVRPGTEDHPFAWGKPSLERRVGDLRVRYVSRAASLKARAEYQARKAAEKAANDSQAAA